MLIYYTIIFQYKTEGKLIISQTYEKSNKFLNDGTGLKRIYKQNREHFNYYKGWKSNKNDIMRIFK